MKIRKTKNKKVIVAMSGGVDSAVAAALLKEQSYDLVGVFMKFWLAPHQGFGRESESFNRCCSPEAESRARQVATILDVPFYVFNFEKEFKERIVDYFLREYKQGRTPNPCVVCNKEIKFGLLLEKALKLGADYVATGHYARLRERNEVKQSVEGETKSPRPRNDRRKICLLRGLDNTKDQSYFLWKLNQKQLKHILFPVGDYKKTKIRELAKKFNLPVLDVPESQEICFIQGALNDFLARYIKTKPGSILTVECKEIGQHQGLPFYTIGQRKGIELSGGPFYVVDKNLKENTLIVARNFNNKNLYRKSLIAKNINWIAREAPKLPLRIKAQIRYGHKTFLATITKKLKDGNIELIFTRTQRAITPGQSIVFYHRKELLGGGIIC